MEDRVRRGWSGDLSAKTAAIKILGRYVSVFNQEQEDELVQHILMLKGVLFGIKTTELRIGIGRKKLVNFNHPFDIEKDRAGKDG